MVGFGRPERHPTAILKLKMTPLGSLKIAISLGPSFKNLVDIYFNIFSFKNQFLRDGPSKMLGKLRRASKGDFNMKMKLLGSSKVAISLGPSFKNRLFKLWRFTYTYFRSKIDF